MFYMVLCRSFHTVPEQGQGPTPIVSHSSGAGTCPSTGLCDYTRSPFFPLCRAFLHKKGTVSIPEPLPVKYVKPIALCTRSMSVRILTQVRRIHVLFACSIRCS